MICLQSFEVFFILNSVFFKDFILQENTIRRFGTIKKKNFKTKCFFLILLYGVHDLGNLLQDLF